MARRRIRGRRIRWRPIRRTPAPKPATPTEATEPDDPNLPTCSWCATPLKPDAADGVTLSDCQHPFCKECMVPLIRHSATQLVKCPVIITNSSGEDEGDDDGDGKNKCSCCTGHLHPIVVQTLLSPEEFKKHSQKPEGKAKDSDGDKKDTSDSAPAKKRKVEDESDSDSEPESPAEEVKPTLSSVHLTEETSSCDLCTEVLLPGDGIILDSCSCTLCKDCVADTVRRTTAACVKCPTANKNGFKCNGHLIDREVKFAVSEGRYEEYIDRSLKEALAGMENDTFQCKTPNCGSWCEIEKGTEKKAFACASCSKINCVNCNAIHEGLDCAKYQEVLAKAREETGLTSGEEFDNFVESQMRSGSGWDQLAAWVSHDDDHDHDQHGHGPTSHQEALRKISSSKLLPTSQPFQCQICMEEIQPGDGAVLGECLHSFCKECLRSTIFHCTDPQVQCPHLDSPGVSCKSFLTPREIQALVTTNVLQNHEARSLRQAELVIPNSFHCSNPDCSGWCILEEEDKKEKEFHCPVCWKDTCLKCKVSHPGVSCEYYKESIRTDLSQVQARKEQEGEKALQKYIKERKLMRCPRCKFICQKISGCSHVNCAACKHSFTWKAKTVQNLQKP